MIAFAIDDRVRSPPLLLPLQRVDKVKVLTVSLVHILILEVHNLAPNLERIIFALASPLIQDLGALLVLAFQVKADNQTQEGRNDPECGHKGPGKPVARAIFSLPESKIALAHTSRHGVSLQRALLGRNHVGCGCSNDTSRHDTELFGIPNSGGAGPRKAKQV